MTKELLLQSGPLTHRQRLGVKAVVHFVPAAMLRPRNEFPMVDRDEVVLRLVPLYQLMYSISVLCLVYDMIYLLTAIGLSRGGRQTQTLVTSKEQHQHSCKQNS